MPLCHYLAIQYEKNSERSMLNKGQIKNDEKPVVTIRRKQAEGPRHSETHAPTTWYSTGSWEEQGIDYG